MILGGEIRFRSLLGLKGLRKYITPLLQNIEDRFAESRQTLQAFSVFDPCNVPKENEPGFLTYGDKQIATLADFLYDGKDSDCKIKKKRNSKHNG